MLRMYYMKEEMEADDHLWPEEEEEVLTGVKKPFPESLLKHSIVKVESFKYLIL